MTDEKMIRMANQIAAFFNSQPTDATKEVANHLVRFWEARMKSQLYAYVDAGGQDLNESVVSAVALMREDA